MSQAYCGVLKFSRKGNGVLRDMEKSFRAGREEIIVPSRLIRDFNLVEGAVIEGIIKRSRNGVELESLQTVCGLSPEIFRKRTPFANLVPVDPTERFNLALCGDMSMRIIDLIAPIGKGTRGLIVSPPRAGKTILLEKLASAIHHSDPETRIVALLIDERPEEVTHFKRAVEAEVIASSNDQSLEEHIELAELALAHIRVELECGRDVVVLVDSLTRMGRAFNQKTQSRGRTMSGGLSVGSMEVPRRFFGLARKVENGGSLTIIATALIDTGSRMDQMIFEEFKGTGNSEIILDRTLAEAHVFPAIDLPRSGTRKEERLYSPDETPRIAMLRRALSGRTPKEAMEVLLRQLEKHPTNDAFLRSIPLKG